MSPDRSQRLPALDALVRGLANARANSELLVVQLFSSLFIVISIAAPIFYLMRQVGIPIGILFEKDPRKMQEAIEGIAFDPAALLSLAGTGLLLLLVGGTVLFLFYCFAQAGTLAVLSAGDAQAPVVARPPVEIFRAFSWRAYFSWSFRWGWRLFWLYNLVLLVFSLLMLLFLIPLWLVARMGESDNIAATCLVACGVSIPIFFLFVVLGMATQVAAAVMVVDDGGAGRSLRRGFALTGRRIGALLLLLLLTACAYMAIGTLFFFVGLGVSLATAALPALHFAATAGLEILQFLLSTVIGLVLTAALIALVRGESRSDAPAGGPPAA